MKGDRIRKRAAGGARVEHVEVAAVAGGEHGVRVAPPRRLDDVALRVVERADGGAQPGRLSRNDAGVSYHDEAEYAGMCAQRAAAGYNSGMGEIFRKVAAIAPVRLGEVPALEAAASTCAENETADAADGHADADEGVAWTTTPRERAV